MPIGFGDATRERFAQEARGGAPISREDLRADKALLSSYYEWWFKKRRDFLVALRDYLRAGGIKDAVILFTPDASEPGRSLPGGKSIVTDDSATWQKLLAQPQHS